MIQKEQDTELPLYPSLRVYENYLQQQGETDNVQKKQIYTSSVPAEENVTGVQTSEQEFEELTDIVHSSEQFQGDQEVIIFTENQKEMEKGKRTHHFETDVEKTDVKRQKLQDDIFPLQVESVVELPVVEIGDEIQIPQLHSYAQAIKSEEVNTADVTITHIEPGFESSTVEKETATIKKEKNIEKTVSSTQLMLCLKVLLILLLMQEWKYWQKFIIVSVLYRTLQ